MARYRPTADVSAVGWTSTAGTLAAAINEAVADDASYITSPALAATVDPYRFSIGPIAAGTLTKTVRAQRTGSVGDVRLVFLDDGGLEVGASEWQAVTPDWAAYTLDVTTTGTATQGEIQARGAAEYSPLSLFAAGEQGAWYDPSDLSTLFQDAAGTTPVTAVEQPVGLMLDKSKGLVLGPERIGDASVGLTGSATAATYNTVTGQGSVTRVDLSNQSFVRWSSLPANGFHRIEVSCQSGSIFVRTGLFSAPQIAAISAGQSITVYGNADSAGRITITNTTSAGTSTFTAISVRELPGNHAVQATVASRPILQIDGNGKYYLAFDGVDDGMATAAVNFTATDKVGVFAGVRKTSDAAAGAVVELSASTASNNGSFLLAAPDGVTATYAFDSKGTIQVDAVGTGFTAPLTSILTGTGNIAGDSAIIRVNGTQADSDTGDQGTGNYANLPIYIGRRGGASLPLNGRIYQLIIRGAATDAAGITAAEAFVNSKTGAY